MGLALLLARLLLVAVFAVAGAAKLADRAGSRQALGEFGIPGALTRPLVLLLPLAELTVAAALVPPATAWLGALAALALLLLFAAAIGVNLARGRKPACRCFGQISSAPAGWNALARNGALASVAGFVAWAAASEPVPSATNWLADLTRGELAGVLGGSLALALVLVEGGLLVNVLRQNGRLLLRLEALEGRLDAGGVAPAQDGSPAGPDVGLPVGSPAPDFALSGLFGETLTLDFLLAAGKPVLLVFSDPNCGPCNALLPEIAAWQREYEPTLTVALISRGDLEANRAKSQEHGLARVLLQQGRELEEAHHVEGTPSALVVRADGTIGSPVAAGAALIRALVATAVGTAEQPPSPVPTLSAPASNGGGNGSATAPEQTAAKLGDRAPVIVLHDLNGRRIKLGRTRGRETLILFWNPQCGFCQAMLDDLRAWEMGPPKGAPKLLVVSTGTPEENRAMGLRSTVVLDDGFRAGSAFGASGAPSGVLVDGDGRIASELAVGASAVLALAGVEGGSVQQPVPVSARIGEPAPAVSLPDLDGATVDLAEFKGDRILVLFWNPACGFCHQMLDDLKAWEAAPPEGAPRLLVVSRGSVDENRGMGLRSPVLLDEAWNATSAFGANGTPMAVLVDEEGRIASEVAAGAPAVMALARGAVPAPAG